MKQSFCKKTIIAALLVTLVLTSVFAVSLAPSPVAEAATEVDLSSQWYYGESDGGISVQKAKDVVSTWKLSNVSSPVVIAVIDTGIDANHELFTDDANGVSVLCKNASGDILGYNSYATVGSDGKVDISDNPTKHGSNVAGIIAMLIREFKLENYIKIYPIKADHKIKNKNEYTFALTDLSEALDWAVDNAHADVINMSLGLTKNQIEKSIDNRTLTEKEENDFAVSVENARRNSVVVAAAGNNSASDQDAKELFYPAAYPGVVSVMNQYQGSLYSSSNYGATYTLCAPGFNIWTSRGCENSSQGAMSKYGYEKGTSMASAFVSFASALLKLRCKAENIEADSVKLAKLMSALATNKAVKIENKEELEFKSLDLYSVVSGNTDNVAYESPKSIDVKHNGTLGTGDYAGIIYMRADSIAPVTFFAQIGPVGNVDPDIENMLEWSVQRIKSVDDETPVSDSQVIGKGTSLSYAPTRGGDFIVTARIPGYAVAKKTIQIHVEYGNYYVGEVRVTLADDVRKDVKDAASSAKLYTTETTRFALTGVQYLNPDVETKWFVNGEYVASGETFEFTPKKAGVYYITAQYGDNAMVDYQYKFTADVKSFVLRPLDLSMLVVGLTILVAVAVAATVIIVRKKKARKSVVVDESVDADKN